MSVEPPVALRAPLEGVRLVEASAGTGKTWTIAWLFVRFVVEKGLTVERILVVTFTRAATGELRDRIRARLREILDALEDRPPVDKHVAQFVAKLPDPELARRRVTAALRGFDDAAIYTIHGFCQRTLTDCAFASRRPFDAELMPEIEDLVAGIVADFWRREIASPASGAAHALAPVAQPLFASWALACGVTPDALTDWVTRLLSKHDLELTLPASAPDVELACQQIATTWPSLRAQWATERCAIIELLKTHPSLNRNAYRVSSIEGWAAELDLYLLSAFNWLLPEGLMRFTAGRIAKASRGTPPIHRFFDQAQLFVQSVETAIGGFTWRLRLLRRELIDAVRSELPKQLSAGQKQSYDGLLQNLNLALTGADGERLARTLRSRYPAALIDEFQDTDPLQYAIFRRIFVEGEPRALFLVGDPKQAIYSFRGADLYAYLLAKSAGEGGLALDENQRSAPQLVTAINTLFGASTRPFLLENVSYYKVRAAEKTRACLRESERADEAPMRFFLYPSKADGKPHTKTEARNWAASVASAEIARLLAGARRNEITLGEAPLHARDLAVLVGTHFEAETVRRALNAHGIGCAVRSRASVFETAEAEQIERVLLACAEPHQESRVKAAVSTDLLGLGAGELAGFLKDEIAWETWLNAFQRHHEMWRDRGFIRMWRRLLVEHCVVPRLARFADGERRLTNLFQLAELLHTQQLHEPAALIHWLATRRRKRSESEDAQLRLESDENLVQVITIHAAKGLEYPVTLVPFLWSGGTRIDSKDGVFFHDPARNWRPVFDLLPESEGFAMQRAREEELAERLRVAYVALTRAKNRCYVFWGCISQARDSALGWLLHDGEAASAAAIKRRVEELSAASKGAIRLEEEVVSEPVSPEQVLDTTDLAVRELARPISQPWRLSSFSALTAELHEEWRIERPDHDQLVASAEPAIATPPGGSRFAFPRGSQAGDCLHRILERIDFSDEGAAWLPGIARELARAGYAREWMSDLTDWLKEIVSVELHPTSGSPLRLSQIPRRGALREMGFHLPLAGVRLRRIGDLLKAYGVAGPSLAPEVLRGYLKGFIDLVFIHEGCYYLADYKSTWLGARSQDYAPAALALAMDAAAYRLQYALYVVALHRFARARTPGYDYRNDFGGVFYLFLRGLHPDWRDANGKPCGVFFDKPPFGLVQELDSLFSGKTKLDP